jgi:hypothetical protein
MRSPFPGMDPYLESHWLDVHATLSVEARQALNRILPDGLIARVEERIAIESADDFVRPAGPDVRVFSNVPGPQEAQPESVAVIDAPYRLFVDPDPITERFVRILDRGGKLITVVEFVSPWNKREPGLEDYRRKRSELLAGGVHVVEIDLVRSGNWRALMRPARCDARALSIYRAIVRTGGQSGEGYLFPIPLRETVPDIPIPLRASDAPVQLPLQSMIDTVYDGGRYDQQIDYRQPPEPPLDEQDAAWADALLSKAGRK